MLDNSLASQSIQTAFISDGGFAFPDFTLNNHKSFNQSTCLFNSLMWRGFTLCYGQRSRPSVAKVQKHQNHAVPEDGASGAGHRFDHVDGNPMKSEFGFGHSSILPLHLASLMMIFILINSLIVSAVLTPYSPLKGIDRSFITSVDSNYNCHGRLLVFRNANLRHPECSQQKHFDGTEFVVLPPLHQVVQSYDADYWYANPPAQASEEFALRAAKHKCKVLQGYGGCSKEFLEEGLRGDFLMICPQLDKFKQQTFVNIDGVAPDTVARCYLMEKEPESYKFVQNDRKRKISARNGVLSRVKASEFLPPVRHTIAQHEIAAGEMPDLICFDTGEAGSSGSGHWFEPKKDGDS